MQNNPITNAFINSALSSYNKVSAKRPERSSGAAKKSDSFVLEPSRAEFTDKITYAASDIASGIRAADDSARAEEIAAKIKAGTYNVSAEDVAKAILGIN
ncbi:MAG: flagellar biosynthesis anti-sigma factor FlgM [Ruminococcus sp.]|jgi:anti-sigma28 factor (negative regulator of flagellin synthesis)|nr:flagellar biosynthesis anti-sigma factor FlgM [Ruminococcus sp.]